MPSRDPQRPESTFLHPLASCSPEERKLVDRYLGRTDFAPGDRVLVWGEHDPAVYFLTEGEVEVRLPDRDVPVPVVAPDILGEVAFFDGSPRSATVVASTGGYLERLSRESFLSLAGEAPDLAITIALALGQRLATRFRSAQD